ncbi:MAG TPA: APC family permease, partial [Nitrospiraceae bacterium]|nr:APC family permease [Nitrospiraceae bacterium]
RLLVGLPLKTTQAVHERLSKRLALAVFASDPLSSVAYATEEILLVLILAGTAVVAWSIPISLTIILLLAILTMSYRQIIFEYPEGGGAYTVAKSNLGEMPGLTAAAALMIDYVLTVSVSVAAGVAAVTSAVPTLFPHRELLGLMAILLVMIVNLRGIRESGRIFAVPTYLFIGAILVMLAVGLVQFLTGQSAQVGAGQAGNPVPAVEGLTLFLLLRAFSSGCTALTGIETISNGVSAFKRPECNNAALTMIGMATILGTMFLGISALAYYLGILPREEETVVSQIARAIFGEGPLYYLVQATTMMILILAANSAFNGFPRLASILARDGYMPHQMALVGDRLVFSNGIMILGVFSCLLIILFRGDTHALIPLYAVGVFLSFTLAQAGMVRQWLVKRGRHWRKKLIINGVGAVTTAVATGIIASTKFLHGAWIVVVLMPLIIAWFRAVHGHYQAVAEQIALERDHRPPVPRRNTVLIPISGVNRAVIRAVDYARSRAGDIRAVLVDVDKEETARIEIQWAQWGCGVNLVVLPSPYRSVLRSLLDYIEEVLQKDPQGWVTVVLPEILPARWWQNILHNQRALLLKAALLFKERVILTDVPFHLER